MGKSWFFTGDEISKGMKKLLTKYIDGFKQKEIRQLLDYDRFSGRFLCPLCRSAYEEIPYFLDHFRFKKHQWEMRLLRRIREFGPRKLPVQDAFEWQSGGDDSVLEDQIKFWVLCLKIHEAITLIPIWHNDENWASKNYVNRIFWELERKNRGVQRTL